MVIAAGAEIILPTTESYVNFYVLPCPNSFHQKLSLNSTSTATGAIHGFAAYEHIKDTAEVRNEKPYINKV